MAATVSPASAVPTFSDQSHLHIPMQGFPERMGRGRSRSESRLSLPRSDSVFSLSRMRPPSAASNSCSVASHTRRQVYTVDRGVLLAKAGIRTQDTPPPPTPLRLVNKTRRIVGAISLADLLVIAKGVSPMGLQQARSSRAQSVTSAPHFMANDGTYAREQRYSSLGALQSLGKTPWDLLGLSNEDFQSAKDKKGESLSQFLKQQSAPTSEWARGLKGQATKGRFAAGSHGCLNLTTGAVRGESKGSSRTRSLDNVHFMDYSPSGKRSDNEDAVSPLSPPSQRRGMVNQEDDEYLPMLSPPTSRSGHRDDDEDADDEEDWLSLLSPSAAKSLRALDEAERPYASHRRRKSRKHRDQDEEESPASGSPPPVRKSQRVKRASESEVSSLISQSAEEDIADGHLDRFTASMPKSPKSPRRRPVLRLNGNVSPSSIPNIDNKQTAVFGRSNSLPSPSKDHDRVGKILPVAPGSPQLQHRWATRSNLSPLISPNFGRKLAGGVGLFDKSPSPLSPKLGFGPGLRRAGGTPPSPRTPAKQRRVNLKNVDAKWPAPLSPDALRKQMMETESAETAPIAEEVINPEFETLLNFLISESAKQATQLNHDSKVTNTSENRKSPSPVICINNNDLSGSTQELNSTDTIDVTEQTLKNISSELEKSNQSSIYVVGSRLSPAPKHGSRSPSPYSAASQSESMPNKPEARPPSPFASQTRLSPTPHTYQNVEFQPTQISDHEKVGETISANVSNTTSNNTDWKSELVTKTNSEAQLGTDSREESKEDWLSLLSPTGARSMRALSEAERPQVSLISGSKEHLNNGMRPERDGSYNSPRISRSPSPYSTGSLKGKRARPTRPPYPLALQIKGSKSSHLDLILKESDMETDAAPKKPSRTRNFSQQSNSHSFSQRSVTSETSFESYELNSHRQMNSRSPSLCSSLRGKRERPIRPPLPLVLQGRASMSSNLNLQPMEYDRKVSPAHDLDTSHPEPSSTEEVIMAENEPAIIPCMLSQKLGSHTPSPYSRVTEQREKSPIQLSGDRSPLMLPSKQMLMSEIQLSGSRSASPKYRTSELSTETPNEMLPSTSPLTLFPAQSLFCDVNHKSVSRSPSPYSKAVEIGNVSPYQLPQDSALIKMDHEQPFVVDTSHNSGSRSASPYYHEPRMVTTNQLPLDATPFAVSAEPSLLCEASQKSVSPSTSPYSRISELRRETAKRLPQEASPTNLPLEPSLLHEEAQTPSPHSVSPYTRISELRRKSENRLARDTSPPELSAEQSLLGDSTQKPASHSSSPFSRISELRRESKNRLPQEPTQPKLSRKQSFLSVFTKKSGSRSASPHSAVSECGSGTPSSLQPSDNTEHNNQVTNEAQRLSHKSDSNISNNLSTSFTEIKPNTTEVNKCENNFETVNLDNESAISSHALDEMLNTNKPNELLDRSESANDVNEQIKTTRPARPSPPPPLSFYRRSPVLLSSIISDNSKTVSNDQSKIQNDAVQEETISQSYRFHDLYATTAARQTDRVTYTKDDIKAILRGEKPLRPPPPVVQAIHRRSSSESSLGETGSNKINKNQDSETEQKTVAPIDVESQSDEVSKNVDNKLQNSSITDGSPVIETKQNKDTETDSVTNITSSTAECKSGQSGAQTVQSTEIQSGEVDQPPPPPPPRLNQRRRSCISLNTGAKELELTANPSKGNSVAPDQTQSQIESTAEVTLSQSYLYDVYASARSRKAGRVTYTKDEIKALLSGEKPVRPPRPYLLRRNSSIGSSLESPKNDNEINTTKENLVDVTTTTEELPSSETDQHTENAAVVTTTEELPGSDTGPQIDNAEDNIVTLDTTLVESPNNEINKTKINNTDAVHTKMESLPTEISPQPLKAVDSKIKRPPPKRPVRPPLPQILLSKSSSSANLFSPKEKPISNKPPMKDKTAVNVKPHGSRSPSPITFMSVKGIGNTRLPMRPPLPVNILVQQWLDKQCKPTK